MIFSSFLSGIFMMGLGVSGLLFLRSWREAGDRLFLNFAIAFWLLALERIPLALFHQMKEPHSLVYLLRLFAFVIIILTIWNKNAPPSRRKRKLKAVK